MTHPTPRCDSSACSSPTGRSTSQRSRASFGCPENDIQPAAALTARSRASGSAFGFDAIGRRDLRGVDDVVRGPHDRGLKRTHTFAGGGANDSLRDAAERRVGLGRPTEPPEPGLGEQHGEACELFVVELRVVDRREVRQRVLVSAEFEAGIAAHQQRTGSGTGLYRAAGQPIRECAVPPLDRQLGGTCEQFAIGRDTAVDHPYCPLEHRYFVGRRLFRRLREKATPARALAGRHRGPHHLREQRVVERQPRSLVVTFGHHEATALQLRDCTWRSRSVDDVTAHDVTDCEERHDVTLLVIQRGQS